MAKVLEQSPSTFARMREEDIRNNFLVQLNGQFQGNATGETFSAAGKPDILVKVSRVRRYVEAATPDFSSSDRTQATRRSQRRTAVDASDVLQGLSSYSTRFFCRTSARN